MFDQILLSFWHELESTISLGSLSVRKYGKWGYGGWYGLLLKGAQSDRPFLSTLPTCSPALYRLGPSAKLIYLCSRPQGFWIRAREPGSAAGVGAAFGHRIPGQRLRGEGWKPDYSRQRHFHHWYAWGFQASRRWGKAVIGEFGQGKDLKTDFSRHGPNVSGTAPVLLV